MNSNHWQEYKRQVIDKVDDFSIIFKGLKKQRTGSDGWMTACCPFHTDTNPSFAYNRHTGKWACFAGCGKGSAFDFIMNTSGMSFKDTLTDLGDRLNVPRPALEVVKLPIKEELVTMWMQCLSGEVRRYLSDKRGLADDTIKKYQIGWDAKRQRYSIPIRDERGNLINVRLYNENKKPKIINFTDGKWKYGSPARLYGLDELVKYKDKQVIICEGEFDRLLLQQEGFMAVTGTHGCATFRPEWIEQFNGKNVVIIYDCDNEGQNAANTILLKAFKGSGAASIKNVELPLRGSKDDKDISDYLNKCGFTGSDLQKLIDETPLHDYTEPVDTEETIPLSSFIETERNELINKKVLCEITVSGETSEAFHAVEEFRVTFCAKLKRGECFDCSDVIKVPRGSHIYVGSCMSTNVQVISMLRAFCCGYGQKPAIEILKRTTIKEFFCHQKVGRIAQTVDENGEVQQMIDGRKQELIEKKVYYLSHEKVKPGHYLATGYVKTHPKTQAITLLIETLVPQDDDFRSFDLEKNLTHLIDFKRLTWSEILDDLSTNVTGVYERDDILIAILLTYCSPLWFRFNGERIRGWLLSIIIGDSGAGKTQTYSRIAEFVNVGDCFSGLTGSRTGLAYALVEHKQKGWQVRIGRYPANSRKILILDETQHMPDWDLRAISKAMDEGFLQIDRVKSKGYECMTRLIMICNPKKDRVMDTYSFGCESLKTLFPPTIIRRVDLAVFANSGDISNISFINKKRNRHVKKMITPEMLKAVIYWVWNLKPDQIIFTKEAEDECLDQANQLSSEFGFAVDVPLVPPSDFRNTLARISAAFAAITLSTNDDFTELIIKPGHVTMSERLIRCIYTHDNCGLDDYSEIQRLGTQLVDYEDIEAAFLKRSEHGKYDYQNSGTFTRTIYILRVSDTIRREDLAEQVGCSNDPIRKVIKLLKRFNLIESGRNGYTKKPKFNKFLRRFLKKHPDFFESIKR